MPSSYSSQTLTALLIAFPFLAEGVERRDGNFVIKSTSPSGHILSIYCEGDELIAGFAEHHLHFFSFDDAGNFGGDPANDAAGVIDYIQDLLLGVTAIAAWFHEGTFSLSYTFLAEDGPLLSLSDLPSVTRDAMRNCNVEVRTWLL